MKTLYFDINGTIVREYHRKPALAGGAFERAVRDAAFERLVCMSNLIAQIKFLEELGHSPAVSARCLSSCPRSNASRSKRIELHVAAILVGPFRSGSL